MMKNGSVVDEVQEVALMIFFEELRLHVRRQGLDSDKYSYGGFRAFLMEQVAVKDEEEAARGSPKNMEQEKQEYEEEDQGMWIEDAKGEWHWFEPAQIYVLFKGKGKGFKGKGEGKGKNNSGQRRQTERNIHGQT